MATNNDEAIAELMGKMEKCFEGYNRLTIVFACSRVIAAMFGPANSESRDEYLKFLPGYLRSMWKQMDEIVQ